MGKNICSTNLPYLSMGEWAYLLDLDTGWEDESAFVLYAFNINHSILYRLNGFKKKNTRSSK